MSTVLLAAVNAIGGLVFGINIGYVPAFTEYFSRNADCSNNLDAEACLHNSHVTCMWEPLTNSTNSSYACLFSDGVQCSFGTKQACDAVDVCVWDYSDGGSCNHEFGWESWEKGLFSGAMIIGAMIGSSLAGYFLAKFGRKKVIGFIGLDALVGTAFMVLARYLDSYGTMIMARIIIGIATGAACVACPLYVSETAPKHLQGPLGVGFQVGCTLGIVLEAFLAFALAPAQYGVQHWEQRIQLGLTMPTGLAALALVAVAVVLPESRVWLAQRDTSHLPHLLVNERTSDTNMKLPLLVAVVLSLATQMTGINAIMNYAPSITKAAGLEPLTGNLLVMIWNFVTALASVPITQCFERRTLYLMCLGLCTVACFLTGIPTFPGVVSDTAGQTLAFIGIAVFILGYEVGVGPLFFVLATELFPSAFTNTGSSFTNTANLVFNLTINFCFPVAVEAISGGPTGNQNKGMAVVFMIFGVIGLLSLLFLYRFLYPWKH